MVEVTLLDAAHAAMAADPEADAARLRFYERLADGELFMLLTCEVGESDQAEPEVFEAAGVRYVLVFDRIERLAEYVGAPAPYVGLSGRVIAGMLAGQDLGLAVNLDVAPSAILLGSEAVTWLNTTLDHAPAEVEARVVEMTPPSGLPEALVAAIDTKLASAMGLAQAAWLVGVRYDSGAQGHLLAFVGAVPQAESALAQAAGEALTFSGIEVGAMDVGFFAASDPVVARMARVGLRFDLPQPQEVQHQARPAPGSDPAKPPVLK